MTPFGEHVRKLRKLHNISQKKMAVDLGVSSAYLSALEHGKRGKPNFDLVQRIIVYFNVIWDDADELIRLAGLSHPRIVIDTSNLSADATKLANHLARHITKLHDDDIAKLLALLPK